MAWITGSEGVFRLHNSDMWCGSLISVEDAAEICGVQVSELSDIQQRVIDGVAYVVELDLHKSWSRGLLPTSPHQHRIGGAAVSLDEIILKRLVELMLPEAVIDQQVPFGRKRVDLRVVLDGTTKLIEFVGPSHFIPGRYQRKPTSPLERKKAVEDAFGAECVVWPFWIQRCTRNVSAIFNRDVHGVAAVWSTRAFFGDFVYPDSATIVEQLTSRFAAASSDGIGYMYGNARTPHKPVHPILAKIAAGKVSADRLIPRGSAKPRQWWLPQP